MAEAQVAPSGKRHADFFVAVRKRGLLNAMLDSIAEAYEQNNPGMRCKWVYAPPTDNTFVIAREGMGYILVDASSVSEHLTASEQKDGPVRRGDLLLMAAPTEIVNEEEFQDARLAYEDSKLPETAYREHLQNIAVKLSDGTMHQPKAVGAVKRTEEVRGVPEAKHELAE